MKNSHTYPLQLIHLIDNIVIILYSLILINQTRKIYTAEYRNYILLSALSIYFAFIVICIFKVIYYFKFDMLYSITSILLLFSTILLCYYKADLSLLNLLSNWPELLSAVLLTISAYNIDVVRIIKTFLISVGSLFATRTVLALFDTQYFSSIFSSSQCDLGFGNHNLPMILLLFLSLCWIYLKTKSQPLSLYNVAIVLLLTSIFYYITRSKTSAILLIFLCILLSLRYLYQRFQHPKYFDNIIKILKYLVVLSPLLIIIITFLCVSVYNYYVTINIDNFRDFHGKYTLLSRFDALSYDFAYNNLKLPFEFVHIPIDEPRSAYSFATGGVAIVGYIDNICHYLIIEYGFIAFICTFILFSCITYKTYRHNDITLMIIISVISLLCIMERAPIRFMYNPFLIILFCRIDNTYIQQSTPSQSNVLNISLHRKRYLTVLYITICVFFTFFALCSIPLAERAYLCSSLVALFFIFNTLMSTS